MAVQKETERCYLSSKDILDNFREVDYGQPQCSIDYAELDIWSSPQVKTDMNIKTALWESYCLYVTGRFKY